MKRSVEFDLFTKIEPNARFASRAGMFAKSKRIADQRAAVKAVLVSTFGAVVPPRYVTIANVLTRNPIRVKLTRIAPGRTADAWENLRAALKAVKDEVARWCGFDDKEGAGITWLDPGQESQGQHVYRVRVEITDASPGQDRIVCLAETSAEGRAAKSRVKREIKKAGTRHGITVYSPEAGARAASSAARSKAEQSFAKLTSADKQRIGWPTSQVVDGKPTALDLRDAVERVFTIDAQAVERIRAFGKAHPNGYTPPRDPGEERPARDLVPCEACGAPTGSPCRFFGGDKGVNGVHPQRARAAGINGVRLPPRAPTNGHRRIVPSAQERPHGYARLPWDGTVRRDDRLDGLAAPSHVVYRDPSDRSVTLTRRRATLPKVGDVWLYE